ncbi:heterokaryon incompatibility protein-domain-containing protein [Lineolata rhizophorae]|uniref:Heterokaryon incompatibility protein-domain-containing protein n=1 Tax=Lineolata rhizophorae TaxID=578093 RepID=A0A6A6NWD3_9PEZI|nr:heterokaryon incompatibility protein-domain-containing protein [Lineolata rhizophorae]
MFKTLKTSALSAIRSRTRRRDAVAQDKASAEDDTAGHASARFDDVAVEEKRSEITRAGPQDPDGLCLRCAQIDFPQVLCCADIHGRHGNLVLSLGCWAAQIFADFCPFCQMLKCILAPVAEDTYDGAEFELRAFSGKLLWQAVPDAEDDVTAPDTVVLAVSPTMHWRELQEPSQMLRWLTQFEFIGLHSLSAASPPYSLRLVSNEAIDFDIVGWQLRHCRSHHERCRVNVFRPVPFLRLMDTETRELVDSSGDDEYVALSYVWGPPRDYGPNNFPEVIEDAIVATRSLGLRYLWVDRYCIAQNESEKKQLQIAAMNLVYQNAVVTLVAAAGQDDSFGFPGVRGKGRGPQMSADIAGKKLLSSLQNPTNEVQKSKWLTRGWTYQEGILSMRRIFFTASQAYFECRSTAWREAMNGARDTSTGRVENSVPERFGSRVFDDTKMSGESSIAVKDRIGEYSRRNLSYNSDYLNAISGVFSAYEEDPANPLYHVWGVPILSDSLFDRASPDKPDEGLLRGLCWDLVEAPSARRTHFPSWSWTGWDRRVNAFSFYDQRAEMDNECSVQVEMKDGTLVDLITYRQLPQAERTQGKLSHRLHLYASVVQFRLRKQQWGVQEDEYRWIGHPIPLENGSAHLEKESGWVRLLKDDKTNGDFYRELGQATWEGIFVGENKKYLQALCMFILIEWEGGVARRIGTMTIRSDLFLPVCDKVRRRKNIALA